MRAVALLATHNEERFIAGCIEHLLRHGVEVYLVDNESTDATVEIASRYRGRGLIEIESFPRRGQYIWRPLLQRKEELAATLDADWFMHVDADEIRLPARGGLTLAEALERADGDGYNAVNFGKTHKAVYSQLTTDNPIDLTRYQLANCYMGRAGLINSGGASSGDSDLKEAVKTAVINKRAGGMGLISGRKAFQRPMKEGAALLNAVQDVYLTKEITIA